MFKFELGTSAKDKVTGFTGVILGRVDYLTGCNQYLLQPKCKSTAKKEEPIWFDENRLEVLKTKKIKLDIGTKINDNGACESAPIK